jgi:hypothetical protein
MRPDRLSASLMIVQDKVSMSEHENSLAAAAKKLIASQSQLPAFCHPQAEWQTKIML